MKRVFTVPEIELLRIRCEEITGEEPGEGDTLIGSNFFEED